MIYSLHALILRNGNVVRSELARPDTVARYLARVPNLADYRVIYRLHGRSHWVPGEGFLALHEAGRIPAPKPIKAMEDVVWR